MRDMQSISGCKINVHQPTGRDIERQIELVGTVGQVDHAKSLIDEKVRAVVRDLVSLRITLMKGRAKWHAGGKSR